MASLLQTSDGDVAVTSGRLSLVGGVTEKGQKLRNRLHLFQGEWFADTREGTPYYGAILVKTPDLPLVKRIFREVLMSVPGIADVPTLDLSFDAGTRELSVEFVAVSDEGIEITSGGEPFIIQVQ